MSRALLLSVLFVGYLTSEDHPILEAVARLHPTQDVVWKLNKKQFVEEYFASGRTYRVLGSKSVARVRERELLSCDSLAASAEVTPPLPLPAAWWAFDEKSDQPQAGRVFFATDDPDLEVVAPQPASEEQHARAMAVARWQFRQDGVSARDLATLRGDVRVIDLGRGNRRIVAAFVAKNLVMGQEEIGIHELFFIARETPQGLLREVSGSYGTFLGAIDLDEDGVAEVIAFGFGYESHSYTIHSLKNGKWEYMYAAEAGC